MHHLVCVPTLYFKRLQSPPLSLPLLFPFRFREMRNILLEAPFSLISFPSGHLEIKCAQHAHLHKLQTIRCHPKPVTQASGCLLSIFLILFREAQL